MQLSEFPISALTGVRVVQEVEAGEYSRLPLLPDLFTGIEIEGENVSFNSRVERALRASGWALHHDDSLRHDGMEFVLEQPLNGEKLAAAITGIFNQYRDENLTWRPSPRSGTHIHLNVSHKTVAFVQAFTALVYCVDELIFNFADEDRRWCSYCNSLNTLPPSVLQALLVNREYGDYQGWSGAWPIPSRDRYYGCNITSVAKYGTVEMRYFPTPTEEQQLWAWMDLCHSLYKVAEGFEEEDNPAEAVLQVFMEDPKPLLESIDRLPSDDEAAAIAMEAAQDLHVVLSVEADPQRQSEPSGRLESIREQLREAARGEWARAAQAADGVNLPDNADAPMTDRGSATVSTSDQLRAQLYTVAPASYFDDLDEEENY